MTPNQERFERQQADKKVREEIRNAVRQTLINRGITEADISKTAADMAREIVNNTLTERKLTNLIDEEITRMVREAMPTARQVKEVVAGAVQKEAARYAQEYVKNNIVLTVNEAGQYPQGGTF